jgi:hypothetical protein
MGENAVKLNSRCGSISHVMGAEVCTSMNFPCFTCERKNNNDDVRDDICNLSTLNNEKMLKHHNHYSEVTFHSEVCKLQRVCQSNHKRNNKNLFHTNG